MYKKIYKKIKEYDYIVIARHVGVDPDALGSCVALRDSILLTFPKKKVYVVGNTAAKFNYIGKSDKIDEIDYSKALLITLDTPDKKRIDFSEYDKFAYVIKIDHHPFIEHFGDIELIQEEKSSACEMVYDLITNTRLKENKSIIEKIFIGIVSDTNRFLYAVNSNTFLLVSKLMKKYDLELPRLYHDVYLRPLNEIRLEGYVALNLQVTDNGMACVELPDEIMKKYEVDAGSAGNMIQNFNHIKEIIVWALISEDVKNESIRVSIRSRGPIINKIAEKYNGGGHALAAGAKLTSFEEARLLMNELDRECQRYIEEKSELNENN